MDWLSSLRPVKSLEFYQRKVLLFLYSSEGKDDLRYLNIPFTELGFFSPMHFISCIPLEMCEPFKNDRLFLASSGELRKGDKVFLVENETEGVIRSAVFKGKRLGKNNEPEVLLDGHRKTYSTEEVVPYKAYLRQHVGTSLEPQSSYVISGGIVVWAEPTWEVGQELYYKPEKRWATVLNREANAKGRNMLTIKMDQTNLKREKVTRVLLNDLKANSIPLRVPVPIGEPMTLRMSTSEDSSEDSMVKVEQQSVTEMPPPSPAMPSVNQQKEVAPPEVETNVETAVITDQDFAAEELPPLNKGSPENERTNEPCRKEEVESLQDATDTSTKKSNGAIPFKSILRKKSKKRDVRPKTEYLPEPLPSVETITVENTIYHEPEPQKFKSCNNLDFAVTDEDLDQMELINYTNSLRSSARKLIQRQLAQEAQQRSLKLRSSTINRPHVAEIFSWKHTEKVPKSSVPLVAEVPNPRPAKPVKSAVTSVSSNDLSKSVSRTNYSTPRDYIDYSVTNLPTDPNHPLKEISQSRSRLDYNFLPLSSSELVKQQLDVVSRVLQYNKTMPPIDNAPAPSIHYTEPTCVSSDSSSHDNDSGRGSFPILSETYQAPLKSSGVRRGSYEDASPTRSPISSDSTGNHAAPVSQVTPGKRYAKNRCVLKTNSQNKSTNEDAEPEEEYNIPHPFTPGNLQPVAGFGRGIQGSVNSSYADATLFALFSCSNIFDKDLLLSKPGQIERGIKKDIRQILRQKIVTPLRQNAYCKAENVTHLREAMLPLSSKMHSALMDAEEFLYLLFDSALNTESFIEFSNGTKEYMHQLVARPKDRSKSQTVQFMLETSLGISGQQFKGVPQPALFLCMTRCKGRLVYYEAIVPSLHLNITKHLYKGPKQCVCEMAATLECIICHQKNGDLALDFCEVCKGIADQIHFRLDHSPVLVPKPQKNEILNLHSIICTRGNRHAAFVKASEHRFAPWLYLDPTEGEYPEVTLLEDFGRWLDSLEKQPGSYREFAKLHPLLKRIMTDSHIYIYSKTHVVDAPNFVESLVI